MKVVTRFAPSPTGFLHLGGATTALFNYLFAKRYNGTYLVRIEDTDAKRSTIEAVQAIHDGLNWLELNTTENIVYQSEQFNQHVEIAYKLLDLELAYKCYLNEEELSKLRIKSRAMGMPIRSPWRDKTLKYCNNEFVIRLKMPLNGSTTINDVVQGNVTINNEILDDMIILRSNKTPTYMLSSVVDDYNMGVTHIIRGDDHFNNAFRQIQIINYLDWQKPVYAHIPLIHGTDGAKLSKRHGATNVYDYHKMGYPNEAMCSYLMQLGWTTNNEDHYNIKDAIKLFSLEKINKSPAKFDIKKLDSINSKLLRSMDLEKIYQLILDYLKIIPSLQEEKRIKFMLPELLKRMNVYTDIKDDIRWILDENFICENIDFLTKLKNAQTIFKEISILLKKCNWSKDQINDCLKNYLLENTMEFKEVAPLLRIALTGKTNTPDIITIIYVLGCEICINRLNYKY